MTTAAPARRTRGTSDPDQAFLRASVAPDYGAGPKRVVVADLFSGVGGMTLGLAEAARRGQRGLSVALAVDLEAHPLAVFQSLFRIDLPLATSVSECFPGAPGDRLRAVERDIAGAAANVTTLLGGPPCQGNSDLNNHTRRSDPRNELYLTMARAAEVLQPRVVLIENVPAVVRDRRGVVKRTRDALEAAGYSTAEAIVNLARFGVPQTRKRHILLAIECGRSDPAALLGRAIEGSARAEPRTVRWAIDDLLALEHATTFDAPSRCSPVNSERMQWLIDNDRYELPNERRPRCHHGDHSYVSMYGRLRWDEPAPTITTGFTSMGQGRYVHPSRPRTLTPHEAARLQTFPDFVRFAAHGTRAAWCSMIGNAVPPLFNANLGRFLLDVM